MARGRGKLTPQDLEYMKIISNNINHFLITQNRKQIDVSRGTGIPPSTLTGYIKGTSLPIPGNVQKIADFFGVLKSDIDPRFKSSKTSTAPNINNKVALLDEELKEPRHSDWISYGENLLFEQNTVEDSKNTVVELFSYNYYDHAASAGTGQYLNDVQVETIELPVDYDADFVIPVYGDSMEPEYHSGDYVFVKLSVELSDGDIGVFEYYGDAYIKQLLIHAEGAFLHSLNDKYSDIQIDRDSDFRIIGKVVGNFMPKEY
ncbi:TPA: helix-turn-helix transcriptional regulator [Streptococcus agalactiae]